MRRRFDPFDPEVMRSAPQVAMTDGLGPLFDGTTFEPAEDDHRLSTLLARVSGAMRSGAWYTLAGLVERCGGTEASVSARLRDLRKPQWGGHNVERRRTGRPGVFEYRLRSCVRAVSPVDCRSTDA